MILCLWSSGCGQGQVVMVKWMWLWSSGCGCGQVVVVKWSCGQLSHNVYHEHLFCPHVSHNVKAVPT